VLTLQSISKRYELFQKPSDRVAQLLWPSRREQSGFWALRNISLRLGRGEVLGIIGPNGSGKSTLLQIVAGVLRQTSGRISVDGRVAALLELGAGFNPEFTGRENVYFNSELMGRSVEETRSVFEDVERFAEIGRFMDRPVREYSSGMYVRLAFATAIHVNPDVLIVDEALAVGDAVFANRCIRKLEEMKECGVAILFVSHDLGLVKRLCHRAILLDRGEVVSQGAPAEVVNEYIALVHENDRAALERYRARSRSHGDGTSEITFVELLDDNGRPAEVLETGSLATVRVTARFHQNAAEPMVGILLRNRLGIDVYGTNSRVEGLRIGSVEAGDEITILFEFPAHLTRQSYTLTVAVQHPDGFSQDWRDDVLEFAVIDGKDHAGVAHLETRVTCEVRRASAREVKLQ
jgi:lipopolysaccharide transport system ATP-binding protein